MKKLSSALLTALLISGILLTSSGCSSKKVTSDSDNGVSSSASDISGDDYTSDNSSDDVSQSDDSQSGTDTASQNSTSQNSSQSSSKGDTGHKHSYGEWKTVKEATCTATGTKQRTCSSCGNVETQVINALGHNFSKATCEAPAKCQRCGKTRGEALGHNYKNGKCTRCGKAQPKMENKKFGYGDTAQFSFEQGIYKGDLSIRVGSSSEKYTGTLSFADKKVFVRIPIYEIRNNGTNKTQFRSEMVTLYDSNGNTATYGNSNTNTSMTCFYDCLFFNSYMEGQSVNSGYIYIPYTGAGTYRMVISDNETFNYSFEFAVD